MTACSIVECSKPVHKRGWCQMHYTRWLRKGTPHVVSRVEDFWSKIHRDGSGCWIWTGRIDAQRRPSGGYPRFKGMWAHRFSYELLVGPIPEGLTIDHLCFRASCVNPSHLEPVTRGENTRRAMEHHRKSHCPAGHEFTEANTYLNPHGHRLCRACHRERQSARYYRLRAEASA